MLRYTSMTWLAFLAIGIVGCGGSDDSAQGPQNREGASPTSQQTAVAQGPAETVAEFLEAIRSGDDEKFASMLTARARRKRAESQQQLVPQGSDTAQFDVGEVEYVGEDGARVVATLSNLDADGQRKTERNVWILRREPEGWRVAAVAVNFNDEPLVMNFEDPDEILRKREWAASQIDSAGQPTDIQAQGGGGPSDPFRR
jgi:hypothetical protein